MKKQILSVVALLSAYTAMAQLPVNTSPENKKAILEEYTGLHCGWCPDGHVIATQIHDSDPSAAVLINIHTGPFAAAAAGEPDLATYVGAQIAGMPGNGVTSYPLGTMNRTVLSGSVMAGGRNLWTGWASTIKSQPAYCNVAVEGYIDTVSAYDPNTGDHLNILHVDAEVYYTDDSPVTSNSITIMLLEDSIHGPQTNYGNPYFNLGNYNDDGTYNHNHVLRGMITPGNYGAKIPVTTAGTTYTASFTYTIPPTYGGLNKQTVPNLFHLNLAAFVTQTFKTTINGAYGPIGFKVGTYTGMKTESMGNAVSLFPNPASGVAKVRIQAQKSTPVSISVYNQVGQLVQETISKDVPMGSTDVEINTQSWATGLYNVVVRSSEGTVTKKLNVVK